MNELFLYKVDPAYLRSLHKLEHKVSVKYNNRPFVGTVIVTGGTKYLLPLTSQTTSERKKNGKGRRSSKTTTFIKDSSGTEIANILHNNMIPVADTVCFKLDIKDTDTYEANEIRYIRKHSAEIIAKAQSVYKRRIEGDDPFLNKVCCDFQLLERNYKNYC